MLHHARRNQSTLWLSTLVIISLLRTGSTALGGPYAPAAGTTGSTAIAYDDADLVAWADGYTDYVVGPNCSETWQDASQALGPADSIGEADENNPTLVSLGQGGQITLTFSSGIADGTGWDFATFEYGISDGSGNSFLELGYVEVSSDGVNFFRFDNDSLTASSVGSYEYMDPTDVTGYCSKYSKGYGTPFDLADLDGVSPLLDVSQVTHVRILDIIGDGTASDTSGDVIYDPYPTYDSAGVDLDAIGVLNVAPEPGSIVLLLTGTVGLLQRRRSAIS